ncbi:hypothetical protein SteCoe_6295 [Stentor coeruleus]|uniref:Uncharacterized protein n=1 Tax=Stentor coeruleus TaxID=5963 RepID=A0A1R2CQE4_9CILI|nr:hypothetical protein SteCoe_6295 [Stentor coeruleus]
MQEQFQIQIKDLNDTIIQILVSPSEKLIEVLIRAGIPIEEDYPCLAAQVNDIMHTLYEKGDFMLSALGFNPSSEISIHKLQPCGNSPLSTFAFNSIEKEKIIPFGRAPRWRAVSAGVSFRGKCNNSLCEAYNQSAYCTLGFGTFDVRDVMDEGALCPICKRIMIEVNNFGFFLAQWKISGRQKGGIKFKKIGRTTDSKSFSTFEEGETILWQYMGLEVRKLDATPFD